MIKAILVINIQGKPRLIKFYQHYPEDKQQQIIRKIYEKVSSRTSDMCNFIDSSSLLEEQDIKLVYQQYATLYFIFCIDSAESELEILDLIRVFVESLDRCFQNVCELDILFHFDKVHYILNEVVLGGLVQLPDLDNIAALHRNQTSIEKQEVPVFYSSTH